VFSCAGSSTSSSGSNGVQPGKSQLRVESGTASVSAMGGLKFSRFDIVSASRLATLGWLADQALVKLLPCSFRLHAVPTLDPSAERSLIF
jgi:hypothetical protein